MYFNCEDCAVEMQMAAANGGRVQQEKMSIGHYGYIAHIGDTEGNMIGLQSFLCKVTNNIVYIFPNIY